MPFETLFLINLGSLAGILLVLWLISIRIDNVNVVDVFWGLAFVTVSWLTLSVTGNWAAVPVGLTLLVSVWGIRLAGYLGWRSLGKPEDYRYAAMRERRGKSFRLMSLFTVFWLQGLIACFISLPLQIGIKDGGAWTWQASFGAAVWLVGFIFESVGDYQMARFKADPANQGKVMRQGLWRYTRHPNYFGDFLIWWGIYLAAAQPENWWWTIIGPVTMSYLLLKVSGVQLLENSLRTRVDGYEEYVENTSSFFPLWTKNSRT
ncbi:MAG: DUF1295 domain-containing protein [Pirellulaceae bacterium]